MIQTRTMMPVIPELRRRNTTPNGVMIRTEVAALLADARKQGNGTNGANREFARHAPAAMLEPNGGKPNGAASTTTGKTNGTAIGATNGSLAVFSSSELYMTADVQSFLIELTIALRKPAANILGLFANTFASCSEEEKIAMVRGIARIREDALETSNALLPDLETMLRIASVDDSLLVQLNVPRAVCAQLD